MPSFGDSIFLFVLALLLFGPKKLPVLARELGKWVGEFRRASNEFKMQMEEELRQVEQADRQKQIAAMEAAAPLAPSLEDPAQPSLPETTEDSTGPAEPGSTASLEDYSPEPQANDLPSADAESIALESAVSESGVSESLYPEPLPIAVSGDLSIMPPSTGLPTPRGNTNPLGGLLDSIPEASPADTTVAVDTESEAHVR